MPVAILWCSISNHLKLTEFGTYFHVTLDWTSGNTLQVLFLTLLLLLRKVDYEHSLYYGGT